MQLEPFEYYLARRRLRWAGHVSRMHFSRLPRMFLSSWVDNKRPRQRPQFNYGHGLIRDLRNAGVHLKAWDTLAGDRNLWHAITQQKNVHCTGNTASGGYAWLDSEQLDQNTEQSLLTPTSYGGVLLGLRSTSTPSTPPAAKLPGPIDSPIKSSLSLLPPLPPQMPLIPQIAPSSSSLNHLNAPLVRCSRRLADKAELTGGRRVYNRDDSRLKPLFPPLR